MCENCLRFDWRTGETYRPRVVKALAYITHYADMFIMDVGIARNVGIAAKELATETIGPCEASSQTPQRLSLSPQLQPQPSALT